MPLAKPASRTVSAPKASRSAALKATNAGPAKRSPKLPEGNDEEPDFGDAVVETAKPSTKKAATAKAAPAAPAPKAAPKAPAKAKGGSVEVLYRLEKETPGAGQYQPVDAKGAKLAIADSAVGAVYIRKDKIEGDLPKTLTATFSW